MQGLYRLLGQALTRPSLLQRLDPTGRTSEDLKERIYAEIADLDISITIFEAGEFLRMIVDPTVYALASGISRTVAAKHPDGVSDTVRRVVALSVADQPVLRGLRGDLPEFEEMDDSTRKLTRMSGIEEVLAGCRMPTGPGDAEILRTLFDDRDLVAAIQSLWREIWIPEEDCRDRLSKDHGYRHDHPGWARLIRDAVPRGNGAIDPLLLRPPDVTITIGPAEAPKN